MRRRRDKLPCSLPATARWHRPSFQPEAGISRDLSQEEVIQQHPGHLPSEL